MQPVCLGIMLQIALGACARLPDEHETSYHELEGFFF